MTNRLVRASNELSITMIHLRNAWAAAEDELYRAALHASAAWVALRA